MTAHDAARASAFMRGFAVRVARRVEEVPFGVAVLDTTLPRVWDLNFVWADAIPAGFGANALALALGRVLGDAGLAHRRLLVPDERAARRLEPEFRALGWSVTRHVVMAHRRTPDRPSDIAQVREVGVDVARAFVQRALREDAAWLDEETVRQLAAQKDAVARSGSVRFLAAYARGVAAAACDLYAGAGVAQIESVMTLGAYRGRGLARAVCLRALAEARSTGASLVFLQADESDWPRALYARLGFDAIGRTTVFRLTRAAA